MKKVQFAIFNENCRQFLLDRPKFNKEVELIFVLAAKSYWQSNISKWIES